MREITVNELQMNPVTAIAKDWMLITAGCGEGKFNTMTASWGHIGNVWGHGSQIGTTVCYVRPQRYTKEFIDREELYTLTFFPGYREELAYLGSHSGRDEDKVAKTGLTPVFGDGYTYFAEASLVLVCRKLYAAPLVEEGFVDKKVLDDCYPERDLHTMYIGEIVKILVADEEA